MRKIMNAAENFLKMNGRLKVIKLGEEPLVIGKDEMQKHTDEFMKILYGQLKFNRGVLLIYIIVLCMLVLAGTAAFIYSFTRDFVSGAFNGGVNSSLMGMLLLLGWRIQKVWKEKTVLDIITSLRPSLKPEDILNFVEILYRKNKKK